MFVLERVKGTVLAVDGHLLVLRQTEVLDLGDVLDVLHVGGVTARAKDAGDASVLVDVVGRNEGTRGVVDDRDHLDGQVELVERLAEHGSAVAAFRVGVAEALGPSHELAVVDLVLLHGVAEGEAEGKLLFEDDVAVLVTKVVLDEGGETVGAEVKELLTFGLLLLLGETELGLGDLELSFTLEHDVADTQVGASEVESEIRSLFVTGGPTKDVGGKHGDGLAVFLETLLENADEAVGDHAQTLGGDGEELLEAFRTPC